MCTALLVILLFGGLSSACFPNYVPDADEEEALEFPWLKKTKWPRSIINKCNCGSPTADDSSIPWNALIEISSTYTRYCSGSLINSKFVLTAFSCLIKGDSIGLDLWVPRRRIPPENVTVWLNNFKDINPINEKANGLQIAEILYDQEYLFSKKTNHSRNHNAVLLRLAVEIPLGDPNSPKPVCLNPPIDSEGVYGEIIGWSKKDLTGIKSQINVQTRINDLLRCKISSGSEIFEGNLCVPHLSKTIHLEGLGFSLIRRSKSNQILQVGLASFTTTKKYDKDGVKNYFFSTIQSILPFINFYSSNHRAKWCKEPSENEFNTSRADDLLSRPWETDIISSDKRNVDPGCTCGIRDDGFKGRIAGGQQAIPLEFKWQVLLRIRKIIKKKEETNICGGSLINNRFILTAAHCLINEEEEFVQVEPQNIDAYIKTHLRKDTNPENLIAIRHVFIHPGYVAAQLESGNFDWDIALLELVEPLTFHKDKLIPICLPKSNIPLKVIGKKALVTGWGSTNPLMNSLASVLMRLEVPIQTLDYCTKHSNTKVSDRFLCAGTLNAYMDSGSGDSGGPLSIRTDKLNQYIQVGLVSWADIFSPEMTLAYYTDTRKMISFIDYISFKAGAKWCSS